MMKQITCPIALCVLTGICVLWLPGSGLDARAWAAESSKLRVAVAGFEKRGQEIPIPDVELIVNDWLTAFLVNTNSFELVERQALEKVLQEQSLGQSGILDPESAAKVGQLLGVNVLVTGTLTYLGDTFEVTARLIDVDQGTIIGSSSVSTDEEEDIRTSVERLAEMLQEKLFLLPDKDGILLSENFDEGHSWREQLDIDFEENMEKADKEATEVSQEDGVLRVRGEYRQDDEDRLFWIYPAVWQKYQSIEVKFRFRDVQGGAVVCLDMAWGEDERWTGLCPYIDEDYSSITIEVGEEDESTAFEFDIRPEQWYVMRLEYQDGMFFYYWEDRELKRIAIEPAISASDALSVAVDFMLEDTRSFLFEIDQLILRNRSQRTRYDER